jgi:hypothetical protein
MHQQQRRPLKSPSFRASIPLASPAERLDHCGGELGLELLVTRPTLMSSRSNQSLRILAEGLAARTFKLLWIVMGVLLLASLGQLIVQASVVLDTPLHRVLGGPLVSILTDTQWGPL